MDTGFSPQRVWVRTPPESPKKKVNMNHFNTSSPTTLEQVMAHQFGFASVRISYPYVESSPELSITRYDDRHGFGGSHRTTRTFDCPRVDVVYNRKRYFGYVQIDTKVQIRKGRFTTEYINVIDDDQFIANLQIMLQDIIDGVIYN
jgi:hypothetical protein